ncbi:DNA alkylation repair protein [Candidatus Peregrinibacteria bacterium]|nr:MAG: DNA alkylation repair protein [Candidatus Peregrinibacteria bacterium]
MINPFKKDLLAHANPEKAIFLQRFFKTGKGEYAEGDVLLGITVPNLRTVTKKYHAKLTLDDLEMLLHSKEHEFRLAALMGLVLKYEKGDEKIKKTIVDLYLANTDFINNWDLVDTSAYKILGHWLLDKDRSVLRQLAQCNHLWNQRIAIVATYAFIRNHQFDDTIQLSEMLINHKHDLMHKAVGWMLREVGKRDQSLLESFLKKHHKTMPRTMLRYAIEKFSELERRRWMQRG